MLTGLELCNQILTQEYRSNDTDYRDFDQFVEMASNLMVIEVGPIPDQVKLRIFWQYCVDRLAFEMYYEMRPKPGFAR